MIKPENRFINLLHMKLDSSIYHMKTNNPYTSGEPDVYYESSGDILWVEYKWVPTLWTKSIAAQDICKTKSWIAQQQWLDRAVKNGKQAYVIVGIGSGRSTCAYVLRHPYNFDPALNPIHTVQRVADWILRKTT